MHNEITSPPYIDLEGNSLDPITDEYEIDNDQYWSAVGDATEEWE